MTLWYSRCGAARSIATMIVWSALSETTTPMRALRFTTRVASIAASTMPLLLVVCRDRRGGRSVSLGVCRTALDAVDLGQDRALPDEGLGARDPLLCFCDLR